MQSDGQAASKRLALRSYSSRVVLSGRFPLRVDQKRPGEFSIIPALESFHFMAIAGIDIPEHRLAIYEMLPGIR
jgi:hypothetical protein